MPEFFTCQFNSGFCVERCEHDTIDYCSDEYSTRCRQFNRAISCFPETTSNCTLTQWEEWSRCSNLVDLSQGRQIRSRSTTTTKCDLEEFNFNQKRFCKFENKSAAAAGIWGMWNLWESWTGPESNPGYSENGLWPNIRRTRNCFCQNCPEWCHGKGEECNSPWYEGNGMECFDIDECNSGSDDLASDAGLVDALHNCHLNATCANIPGNFTCTCNIGFAGDGVYCQDVDECEVNYNNECHINAECINTIGSYDCKCNHGYKDKSWHTTAGYNCVDINECASVDLNDCDEKADCVNLIGEYECNCKTGYDGSGYSGDCSDVDECTDSYSNSCHVKATCDNTVGSYVCKCVTGYSGSGQQCSDINECTTKHAKFKHNCHDYASCINYAGSFECKCKTGFDGNGEECIDINECNQSACSNCSHCKYDTCNNNPGSYSCGCMDGYQWSGSGCVDTNECALPSSQHQCQHSCSNYLGGYSCVCNAGYTLSGKGTCSDIDECHSSPCHSNAQCSNLVGSYQCQCKNGYYGNGFECTECKYQDEPIS